MREIKFRGWNTRKKVMHSAEEMGRDQLTLSVDGRGFINVSGKSTKLSTFPTHIIPMQYTGLKDKDRVEICEGDVAEVQVGMDIYKRYVVEFDKRAYYKLQSKSEKHQDGTFKSLDFCEVEDCEIEVVGNIHEKDLTGNQNPDIVESYGIQNDKSSQKSDKQCPARASSKSENKTENRDCESKKDKA